MNLWLVLGAFFVGMTMSGQDPSAAKAESLLQEADTHFGKRDYKKAHPLYIQAAGAAEKEDNHPVLVEALAQDARCHSLNKNLKEGRVILAKAEALASPEEPRGWSRLLGVRGIFEREEGDKERAKATFAEMFEYCKTKGLNSRALDAIHHIAIVVPLEEQAQWGKKGIALAEEMQDEGWQAVLWNNLGVTYEDLKKYPDAVEAYSKARHFHHRTGDEKKKLIADWALGHAQALARMDQEAEALLVPTLKLAQALHGKDPEGGWGEWVAWCQKDLGQLLAAQGKREKALAYLEPAHQALIEAGIKSWWPSEEKALAELITSLKTPQTQPGDGGR